MMGEDADFHDIFLIPPDDGEITEEESGDEAEADMNHLLPPRVLRSTVEVNMNKMTNLVILTIFLAILIL